MPKLKLVLKILGYLAGSLALILLLAIGFLLLVADDGIPFIEGDTVILEGERYGFSIGMSKQDAYEALKTNYSNDEHYVRILWRKGSDENAMLERFQNTSQAQYTNRIYSETELPIIGMQEMPLPLELVQRWDVQLPASWINTIYLTFEDTKLVEIQRSRWLFERP